MRSGRFRARPGGLLGCPRAGLFGLVGKFHPFLGEHAPRNLADLIHRGVCPSPALLRGEAAVCRKVLPVVGRTHWPVFRPPTRNASSAPVSRRTDGAGGRFSPGDACRSTNRFVASERVSSPSKARSSTSLTMS